jgi:hypothetical protein
MKKKQVTLKIEVVKDGAFSFKMEGIEDFAKLSELVKDEIVYRLNKERKNYLTEFVKADVDAQKGRITTKAEFKDIKANGGFIQGMNETLIEA